MDPEIRRYPCGCKVPDGATSCEHVDVAAETRRGWEIQRRNDAVQRQRDKESIK